jgi:histidyl-tRNA synthetase
MRDFLPPTAGLRRQVAERILDVYESYGFELIETPALEDLAALLGGGAGENEKLIFKVLRRGARLEEALAGAAGGSGAGGSAGDRGPEGSAGDGGAAGNQAGAEAELADTGLRFDLTVPLARFVANHQNELPMPFKAAHLAPVWRAERPQRGRYREFTQCDIDIIGEPSVAAEVELVSAGLDALTALGIQGCTARLNDRRLLRAAVEAHLGPVEDPYPVYVALDKLDRVPPAEVARGLSAFGDERSGALIQWASQADLDVAAKLPGVAAEVVAGLRTTLRGLSALGWSARFDPALVRGLGYYTGQIFEVSHPDVGYSLAGGGRYDGMTARFGAPALSMCGLSIGFERVFEMVDPAVFATRLAKVAVLCADEEEMLACLSLARARKTKEAGATYSVVRRARNARKQTADLERLGYKIVDGAELLAQ